MKLVLPSFFLFTSINVQFSIRPIEINGRMNEFEIACGLYNCSAFMHKILKGLTCLVLLYHIENFLRLATTNKMQSKLSPLYWFKSHTSGWFCLWKAMNEKEDKKNWTIDLLKLLQNWLSDSLFFHPILKGYKLHGPSIKHCNGTGHWDDYGNPICMRKYPCEFVYCHHNFLTLSDLFSIRFLSQKFFFSFFYCCFIIIYFIL